MRGHLLARDRLALARWLTAWARCIRREDYAGARTLFTDDVIGFGTHAAVARGRRALEREQWRHVWPHTDGFRFALRGLRCMISADRKLAVVWLRWSSTGRRASGVPCRRPGRATILLRRDAGRWRAFHTHFSLVPGTPGGSLRQYPKADHPAGRGLRTARSGRPRTSPQRRRARAVARRPRDAQP